MCRINMEERTRAIDGFCLGGAFYMDSDGDFLFFIFMFFLKESVYLLLCGEEEGSKFSFPFGRS